VLFAEKLVTTGATSGHTKAKVQIWNKGQEEFEEPPRSAQIQSSL
jgi:hypothetical protein